LLASLAPRRRSLTSRAIVIAVIVLLAWAAALLLALILLAVVGLEFRGHLQRLSATLGAAQRDLLPRVGGLAADLRTAGQSGQSRDPVAPDDLDSTPGGPGRHRAGP
jgi:hypothetical protein